MFQAAEVLNPSEWSKNEGSSVFKFGQLSSAVYCSIIYDEWLKLMDQFIETHSMTIRLSQGKIKAQLEEFSKKMTASVAQPTVELAVGALSELSSHGSDISVHSFRRAIFISSAINAEIHDIVVNSVRL